MNITYMIHRIPSDEGFSLALSLKNSDGFIPCNKRSLFSDTDKKFVEALIKDFNAHKTLKQQALEYGRFERVLVSDKQVSYFFTELAKVREVQFEAKKVVVDALSFAKLFFEIHVNKESARIYPFILDGIRKFPVEDIEAFFGEHVVWIYHKGVIKKLKQDFKWLKMAFERPILSGKKKEDFLDHYENDLPLDSSIPEAIFRYEKLEDISPCPVLQMTNQRGLFFGLEFEYAAKGRFLFLDPSNPHLNRNEELFWEEVLIGEGVKKSGREYFVSAIDQEKIFRQLLRQGFSILTADKKQVIALDRSSGQIEDFGDQARLNLDLKFGPHHAALDEIVEACQKKTPFVTLSKDQVGLISHSMLDELQVLLSGNMNHQSLMFPSHKKGDLYFRSVAVQETNRLDPHHLKFTNFDLNLFDFQKLGVAWILSNFMRQQSCLLADDMGLGKTIQVLAVIDLLVPSLNLGVVIVCPKSIKSQWQKEIAKHLKNISVSIQVMTFHELRSMNTTVNASLVVVDEAQNIKNAKTQLFQKTAAIQAPLKLCLTGTPIENSLNDLVTLYQFLSPQLVEDFQGLSVTLNQVKIRKRIQPFLLRRTKKEVLKDLPPLIEQIVEIEMDENQGLIYQNLIQEARRHPTHALSLITKLRLCALDPRLIDSQAEMSTKTWQILEDIESIIQSTQKVIVFSQFTSYLALLCEHLKDKGLSFSYLDGQTKNRDEVLQDFAHNTSILLMSLKAGGVGLNLQMADYVIIADPWWNQAAEAQAIDRAYRLGRQNAVVARRYVTSSTLEMKIQDLKASKWALLDELSESQDSDKPELLDLIFS